MYEPDDLVREIKLRAVNERRKLKEVVADLLAAGLEPTHPTNLDQATAIPKSLPVIKLRPVQPGSVASMTGHEMAQWISEVDLQLEVERYEKALGYQHVDRVDVGNAPAS